MVLYGFSNSCVTALQVTTSTLQKVNSTVIKVSAAVVAGTAAVWLVYRRPRCVISPQSRLVAITGCDSGVGYSAAIHCHQQGFWVLAMVLSVDSKGAQVLTAIGKDSGRLEVLAVDVTKPEQVAAAVQQVTSWLDKDPPLVFHALMNNAGVMVFGETEWQTEHIISQQLDVNLAGSIRVARLFAPVLLQLFHALMNNAGVMVFGETEWQTELFHALMNNAGVMVFGETEWQTELFHALMNNAGVMVFGETEWQTELFHALMNNAGVMVFGETEWQTERIISQQLDVNLAGSIRGGITICSCVVAVFHALMNNAGVMVFGETEWQTERIISQQLDVNLAGSIRVARLFAPVLRKYKGRLINVTSHCATLPLPGLAVYAASKAGLQAWSDALRVEWAKYGITVISFIPGALFQQTQILASQVQYAGEMKTAMTAEAAGFYGQYYHLYQMYLSGLGGGDPAAVVQSDALYRSLDSALLDSKPYTHYHDTPWRYRFYHTLAHLTSVPIRDFLVLRFTGMPPFIP
ncbi:D-beta-hydroxybutyrate dehydrogenase, mitochondrial [Homalodisca vitripennis]|uniref:D-beta-hydroxybutyrate dehydrogenase, mitochondrial n=1 Tax=Homalodisca vitripennis TaxID=197043 RepID=UPI001EE9E251|nr:D-beta-hydroxybutyrate dehydrogenase, mitochondrial [Homalodisca vitripennis]